MFTEVMYCFLKVTSHILADAENNCDVFSMFVLCIAYQILCDFVVLEV